MVLLLLTSSFAARGNAMVMRLHLLSRLASKQCAGALMSSAPHTLNPKRLNRRQCLSKYVRATNEAMHTFVAGTLSLGFGIGDERSLRPTSSQVDQAYMLALG